MMGDKEKAVNAGGRNPLDEILMRKEEERVLNEGTPRGMKVSMGRYEMEVTPGMLADLCAIHDGDHMPEAIDRIESVMISMYRGEVDADMVMGCLSVLHDIKDDYELLLTMNIRERKEAGHESE